MLRPSEQTWRGSHSEACVLASHHHGTMAAPIWIAVSTGLPALVRGPVNCTIVTCKLSKPTLSISLCRGVRPRLPGCLHGSRPVLAARGTGDMLTLTSAGARPITNCSRKFPALLRPRSLCIRVRRSTVPCGFQQSAGAQLNGSGPSEIAAKQSAEDELLLLLVGNEGACRARVQQLVQALCASETAPLQVHLFLSTVSESAGRSVD